MNVCRRLVTSAHYIAESGKALKAMELFRIVFTLCIGQAPANAQKDKGLGSSFQQREPGFRVAFGQPANIGSQTGFQIQQVVCVYRVQDFGYALEQMEFHLTWRAALQNNP
jgi:hypothetical protein